MGVTLPSKDLWATMSVEDKERLRAIWPEVDELVHNQLPPLGDIIAAMAPADPDPTGRPPIDYAAITRDLS